MEIVLNTILYGLATRSERRELYKALAKQGYPKWIFRIGNKRNKDRSDYMETVFGEEIQQVKERIIKILSETTSKPKINVNLLDLTIYSVLKNKKPSIFLQAIADVFGLQDRIATYDDLVQLNKSYPQYEEKYEYFRNLAEKYKKDPWNFVNEVLEKYDLEEMMYAYMLSTLSFSKIDSKTDGYIILSYSILIALTGKELFDFVETTENPKTTRSDIITAFSFMDKTCRIVVKHFGKVVLNDS